MAISVGTSKKVSYKKQASLGTEATGAGAQYLRRVTSTIDLKKETYTSAEIRPSQQRSDMRHGARDIQGTLNGELSVGTYGDWMESTLRQDWQTAATSAESDITVQTADPQFTTAAGDFIADGHKVGDVVRWTGLADTSNNDNNFLVTGLTATTMTGIFLDGDTASAEAAGNSFTVASEGKKIIVPTSSHTRDYYTIEHWFSDINQSERFVDCMIGAMNVKLPGSGIATIDFPVMGLSMETDTSEHFTTPTDATCGSTLAAVSGAVYVQGTKIATITSMDINVNGNVTLPDGIVGSDAKPDLFPGTVEVDGTISIYFENATMRDYFVNETEVSIMAVFTSNSSDADADFITFVMPKVKLTGADKDDGEKGLMLTTPFTALENANCTGSTTAYNETVIAIQDSSIQ